MSIDETERPKRHYTKCCGCHKKIPLRSSKYCHDRAKLEIRLGSGNYFAEAREYFWAYIRKHGHRCCYTEILLEIDDYTSPWYLVFSRLHARDKAKILPASAGGLAWA